MELKLPQRKTPRAQWIEYNAGSYFITICTHNFVHYFGEIEKGEMNLTDIGKYLIQQLEESTQHHPYIEVLQYVVMPNHIHAIVEITEKEYTKSDAAGRVPTAEERISNKLLGKKPLLSTYVCSLKSSVTKYAHQQNKSFKWQARYHDHFIRGVKDCNNISQYITNNVINWEKDCFHTL